MYNSSYHNSKFNLMKYKKHYNSASLKYKVKKMKITKNEKRNAVKDPINARINLKTMYTGHNVYYLGADFCTFLSFYSLINIIAMEFIIYAIQSTYGAIVNELRV